MRTIQVTLGATATQVTTGQIYSPFVIIQNNASHSIRVGDNTVTSSKGINVSASGSITIQRSDNRILLKSYYIFGTQNDVIDILYE